MADRSTIFAVATAAGRSAIAIIRVSGPKAIDVIAASTGEGPPKPRLAAIRSVRNPVTNEEIDRGLVLWFPGPESATGEDVCELHVHGGPAILDNLIDGLGRLDGLRLAEPGEYTRRSFENGKLDLTSAEGIGDLVDAETEAQRRQAFRQANGALADLYDGWRVLLIDALSHLEAAIDFADEDIPSDVMRQSLRQVNDLRDSIDAHLADARQGERIRDGVSIAIVGAPNVGKSSLLNALARRDVAIVSSRAGTTRDIIEISLNLNGYVARIADTAGLRSLADLNEVDPIEAEGILRAKARAEASDLRIVMLGANDPFDEESHELIDEESIVVVNKIDLPHPRLSKAVDGILTIDLSVTRGDGLDRLERVLADRVVSLVGSGEPLALTRARHREALEAVKTALDRAVTVSMPELIAEDLRIAGRSLGKLTGRVDVEDLLDVIFRDFCIGK